MKPPAGALPDNPPVNPAKSPRPFRHLKHLFQYNKSSTGEHLHSIDEGH
jgi:hypothetical protein